MNARGLLTVLLAVLAMAAAQGADGPPIHEASVTTVVKQHRGGVGGVVVDQLGFVYVADFHENVWRLDPANNELSLYSSGLYGASGNTFDRNGNLYQANFYGHSIQKISRSGEMSTVLTDGLNGPVGMVFDDAGNLMICSCNDQSIKKLTPEGSVTTFATSAEFNCPNGITRNDAGDFFVVSFSSPKIMKITPDGEISEFANTGGNGVGHIVLLRDVFYATSFVDNKIYRISADGSVSLFSGDGERSSTDGPVAEATFSSPNGIAADPTGNYLYINDYIGDQNAMGATRSPFSLRRIELPRLNKIMAFALESESRDAADVAYRSFKDDPASAGENTESEMNSLGWGYMSRNEFENAAYVFKLNAESYPDSWRAYSSLGASYMRVEERDLAISALKKSLELNPENVRATARLKELDAIE